MRPSGPEHCLSSFFSRNALPIERRPLRDLRVFFGTENCTCHPRATCVCELFHKLEISSPECSKLISGELTEMPRSRSGATQSECTSRRPPRTLYSPASG